MVEGKYLGGSEGPRSSAPSISRIQGLGREDGNPIPGTLTIFALKNKTMACFRGEQRKFELNHRPTRILQDFNSEG